MSGQNPSRLIAVVAFHQVIPFHLAVPCMVFGEGVPHDNPFEVVVCAGEPGVIRTSTGFGLCDLAPLDVLERADAIVMPGWRDTLDRPPDTLLDALRAAHLRGTQIVGLCLGTHVLASAGLLDQRRATTHWEFASAIAHRFPQVAIDGDVLYVEDGNLMTSAGTAASLDACLHLLRKRLGAAVAIQAARRMIVAPHRNGRQAQFVDNPLPNTEGDARLSRVVNSARERLNAHHTLDSLASEASMSRRTFTRHFKALTGTTVNAWLSTERLLLAQRLLESSDQTLQAICEAAGFGSIASLRQHFQGAFGVSPTAWRSNFRGQPQQRRFPARDERSQSATQPV